MGQNSGKNQNLTKNKHYLRALNKEQEIIKKYTNLQIDKDLKIFNVEFKFNGKDTFIHTLLSGEQNQQIIVLVHGYLATSLFYYKIIEKLSQNYKVYSIDLLGMGLSDRYNFEFQKPKNAEVATQLFVESLEEWRKALGINSFKLAGHSFGGFISFNYNLYYPERVEQIILISPMSGSSVQPKHDLRDNKKFKEFTSSLTFKKSLFPKFLRCMHEKKMTLSKFLQSSLIPSDYFINKIIDQRFDFETKEEKQDWITYFKSIQLLPESTDHLIHEFVSMPYVQPKISIEEIIQSGKMKEQRIPIHYIYGGEDWMDCSGTRRLLNNTKIIGSIDYIKNAGHLIPFEQPEYLIWSESQEFVDEFQKRANEGGKLYMQEKEIQTTSKWKLINIDSLKQQNLLFGESGLFSSFNHGQLNLGFQKFKVTAKMCHSSCQQCKQSDTNVMCTECAVNFELLNGRCLLKQMLKSVKLEDFIDNKNKVNYVSQNVTLLNKCYNGCISCNYNTGICKDAMKGKRFIEKLFLNQFSKKIDEKQNK